MQVDFRLVVFVVALLASHGAQAQPQTGYDLELHGYGEAVLGRTLRLRGTAYEVYGLATLRPASGAHINARYGGTETVDAGPLAEVLADARGHFVLEVPIPHGAHGQGQLEVAVGDGATARTLRFPLQLRVPITAEVRTDRRFYEPGETVHVWTLVVDRQSGAPALDQTVDIALGYGANAQRRSATTSEAGVAHVVYELPNTADNGSRGVEVRVAHGALFASATTRVEIGRRTVEPLQATVELTPDPVAPSAAFQVRVHVRTASGAAVRNAQVQLTVPGVSVQQGTTDAEGIAIIDARAPAFVENSAGRAELEVSINHPGHGQLTLPTQLSLSVPLALRATLVASAGAAVPEVEDVAYLSMVDASLAPPPPGTEVRVSGPAVRGGGQTLTLDESGLAEIALRLPDGAAAPMGNRGPCGRGDGTFIEVSVEGDAPRITRACLKVASRARVLPVLSRRLFVPGETIEVALRRRPSVARRPISVDLLAYTGERWVPVDSTRVAAGSRVARLRAPMDRVGVLRVRARPSLGDTVGEGAGAEVALLVRPAHPSYVSVQAGRAVYPIGAIAELTVQTNAQAPRTWLAVDVRDLAQHGGERAFARHFLARRFREALLNADSEADRRLLAAALSRHGAHDVGPGRTPALADDFGRAETTTRSLGAGRSRGDLRDPHMIGLELTRRGVSAPYRAVEEALVRAANTGDVASLMDGGGRRLRRDLLEDLEGHEEWRTLGGAPLTLAVLEAADPGFHLDTIARRVTRGRLVKLMSRLAAYLDPGHDEPSTRRAQRSEPEERWLSRLVQLGGLRATDLLDAWGRPFVVRRAARRPALVLSARNPGLELVSPGPDGRAGTADDVRDPFARAVPEASPYAYASGENALLVRLGRMAPGSAVLAALEQAYGRLGLAAVEEQVGDAASATASEGMLMGDQIGESFGFGGLGLTGSGAGGSGSGYGRGVGGLSGRHSRVPRIRRGFASVQPGGGLGMLGDLLRERFPATLRFIPELRADASGTTRIEVPLADAATTYLVEVIAWSEDGWSWTGRTRLRTDRDLVVDAPIPVFATAGDEFSLPLRAANRSAADRSLRLTLVGSEAVPIDEVQTELLRVPGGDAVAERVTLRVPNAGRGTLTLIASDEQGRAIDAVRRPIQVVPEARRRGLEEQRWLRGSGELSLTIPSNASALEAGRIRVMTSRAIFHDVGEAHEAIATWAALLAGETPEPDTLAAIADALATEPEAPSAEELARFAVLWRYPRRMSSSVARLWLEALTRSIEPSANTGPDALTDQSRRLLALAPAARSRRARPGLRDALERLLQSLRGDVEMRSARTQNDAAGWAVAAAALAWTTPRGAQVDRRAHELVRRAERSLVTVGDERWLEAQDRLVSTAYLALAEAGIARPEAAYPLVRTLARRASDDGVGPLPDLASAWASAVVTVLASGPDPTELHVMVDGSSARISLEGGVGVLEDAALTEPGTHRVEVDADPTLLYQLEARSRVAVPWAHPPPRTVPMTILVTPPRAQVGRRGLGWLEIRSRAPRLLPSPVVEITLPAGAIVDHPARVAMARHTIGMPRVDGHILSLRLRSLAPGQRVRIPLQLRFGVPGDLSGYGVVAHAADRPEAMAIVPPQRVRVSMPSGDAR